MPSSIEMSNYYFHQISSFCCFNTLMYYAVLIAGGTYRLELCADVIVSAAARPPISAAGGAPPVTKNRRQQRRRQRRRSVGGQKQFFSKIHEKISFYPQNFLRNFFSHQSF